MLLIFTATGMLTSPATYKYFTARVGPSAYDKIESLKIARQFYV